MNQLAIADLSAELIMRYYENDYMPFLNHMDDEALWYGPAEGQFLQGREAMIRVWNAEEHSLKFSLGNMEVTHITANPSFCDVLLSYPVTTHYPGNRDITLSQRILLTWCERVVADQNGGKTKEPRILVCHIANLHAKHADDFIYPNKFHEVYPEHAEPPHGKRIHFHGWDRSDYFVLSDTILYISAAHGSKHSEVHTTDGTIEVAASVSALAKQYGRLFLRCHHSHLVNPDYIQNIRRFKVTLSDGTELPIPEKNTPLSGSSVKRDHDTDKGAGSKVQPKNLND